MRKIRAAALICTTALLAARSASAATPIVVQNEAGFEGLEEPTVLYFPGSNTFQTGDTFQNHVDEGGGMFRDTLRDEYPTPLAPYASGPGWWDGDGANPANTDRQRSEPKGIVGLGHQQVDQTFEYSFDFRTDPTFTATSSFCHIFQLKATNGDDSPPLATISLYKNGSGIQGRVDCFSDGTSGTPQTETIPTTFSYTAGQWIHFDIRITPCAQGETTGSILLSVNGGPFTGVTNAAIDLQGSTDFRPKFGFYRGISITNGVTNIPVGDSWVEHRTITGYIGTSNVLTWAGGLNSNTWDTATTSNFLNGTSSSVFNTIDQINFTNSSANTNINISGSVWPGFADVNSSQNYTFSGTGSITGGTLRKDGTGTLTLATTNSYDGLTDVRSGTLFVTGSIGNNSLVSLTGGILKAGSATALGSNSTIGTQIAGGTLDINGFNLTTEPISVQGAGVSNAGAIINTGAQQTSALTNVTLTGDTTFGGTGRWDIRGTGAALSTGGSAYNLTKTGTNQISFVGAAVDSALANITISQGILAFQTSTSSMGNPAATLTISPSAILGFFNTTNTMTKTVALNGGTIWSQSGTGSQNNLAGSIAINSAGGILDAGSALAGGSPSSTAVLTISAPISGAGTITKNGPGSLTLSGANTYTGGTVVNAGSTTFAAADTFPANTNLTIAAGAVAVAANHGSNPINVIQVNTLSNSGLLDLTNNDLIAPPTALSTITAQIKQGLGGTIGITSSTAAADSTHRTALGEIVNDNGAGTPIYNTFDGANVVDGDVLVKYTWYGDADLSGTVSASDYTLIDNGFNKQLTGWFNGDFNDDGKINGDDYTLIDNSFNTRGSTSFAATSAGPAETLTANVAQISVPEPAQMSVTAIALIYLLSRRRRQAQSDLIEHIRGFGYNKFREGSGKSAPSYLLRSHRSKHFQETGPGFSVRLAPAASPANSAAQPSRLRIFFSLL